MTSNAFCYFLEFNWLFKVIFRCQRLLWSKLSIGWPLCDLRVRSYWRSTQEQWKKKLICDKALWDVYTNASPASIWCPVLKLWRLKGWPLVTFNAFLLFLGSVWLFKVIFGCQRFLRSKLSMGWPLCNLCVRSYWQSTEESPSAPYVYSVASNQSALGLLFFIHWLILWLFVRTAYLYYCFEMTMYCTVPVID